VKELVEKKESAGKPDPELPHPAKLSRYGCSQWNISARMHEKEAAKDPL